MAEIYYDLAWYYGEAKHGAPAIKKVATEMEGWDIDEMFEMIRLNNEMAPEFKTNLMDKLDQIFDEENHQEEN